LFNNWRLAIETIGTVAASTFAAVAPFQVILASKDVSPLLIDEVIDSFLEYCCAWSFGHGALRYAGLLKKIMLLIKVST
jgi:hypothetical protein